LPPSGQKNPTTMLWQLHLCWPQRSVRRYPISVNVTVAPKFSPAFAPVGTVAVIGKDVPDRVPISNTTSLSDGTLKVVSAPPVKEPIVASTVEVLSAQSSVFPCVIEGVRLCVPVVPFVTVSNSTAWAVTVEATEHAPTVPLTVTSSAKAADVPIKVETPSAMIAIAANLDLLDFANIFDSPYFFSQDWMVPELSQSYLEIAVFCCQKLGLTPVLRG
jgi:hypothetical protein